MMDKGILDALMDKDITINDGGDDIIIPMKCSDCENQLICSVLPTFIAMSNLGIIVSIEECKFYGPPK